MHINGVSLSYGALAVGTVYIGHQLYRNKRLLEEKKEIISKAGFTTTISTAVTAGGMLAYKVQNPSYLKSSAYIESLNDEQLASLSSMLDEKINTIENTAEKQLVKKL